MAKNKKKKTKTIQLPQSEETKIRSRARNMKIGKCFISSEWEESRKANIIVTRVHTNGNLTLGFFHIDLALLGVVDAFYRFNTPDYELDDLINQITQSDEDGDFIEIDYVLAHNIIYGSIEFAEDNGFYPHKYFRTAKYILEEDDENIPLMDIEFGIDGKPTIFTDEENPRIKEIAQLEETAGNGNFNIFYGGENILEDDKINDLILPGWDDDIDEMGVPEWDSQWIDFFKQEQEDMSIRVLQYFADMTFLSKNEDLADYDSFRLVLGSADYNKYSETDYDYYEGDTSTVLKPFLDRMEGGEDPIYLLEEINRKFKDSFDVLFAAHLMFVNSADITVHLKNLEYLLSLFPENLELYNNIAAILYDEDRSDEIKELMKNRTSLDMMSDKKIFSSQELIAFCSIWVMYHMDKNDLRSAEIYYQVLDTISEFPDLQTKYLIQNNVLMKMESLSKGI